MVPICLQLCIPGIPVYPSAFVLSMTLHNTVNVFSLYKSPQCLALVKKPYKHLKPAGEERPSYIDLHLRQTKINQSCKANLKDKLVMCHLINGLNSYIFLFVCLIVFIFLDQHHVPNSLFPMCLTSRRQIRMVPCKHLSCFTGFPRYDLILG